MKRFGWVGSMMGLALSMVMVVSAWATNGMNIEGYGPVANSMGGVSIAFENGTAAVMNNPATLGLGTPN